MKSLIGLVVGATLAMAALGGEVVPAERLEARKEFADLKFGIFLHWGIYSTFAQGEWYLESGGLRESECAKAANALYPHLDGTFGVKPLAPSEWDWWCVDGIRFHGKDVTILFDRDGTRYGKGKGLVVLVDGETRGK